jgi:hypothetical protein
MGKQHDTRPSFQERHAQRQHEKFLRQGPRTGGSLSPGELAPGWPAALGVALVVAGGIAFVGRFQLAALGAAAAAFILVFFVGVAWRASTPPPRTEIEPAEVPVFAVLPRAPQPKETKHSLVGLMIAFPAACREAVSAELALDASASHQVDRVLRFVVPDGTPDRAMLLVAPAANEDEAPETLTALGARTLDALAARDLAPSDGYRGSTGTLSREGSGSAVLAFAIVVADVGAQAPIRGRQQVLAAAGSAVPAASERVTSIHTRWIPEHPTHAFDDAALARAFPELGG